MTIASKAARSVQYTLCDNNMCWCYQLAR